MINNEFDANNSQIILQLYDKDVIDKDYVEKFLHMNFQTGNLDKEYWTEKIQNFHKFAIIQFFIKLYDRELILKEVLMKLIFEEKEYDFSNIEERGKYHKKYKEMENKIQIDKLKPKIETQKYYDYADIATWLIDRYPHYEELIDKDLWKVVKESTGFHNDTTVYLDFGVFDSYLPNEEWAENITKDLKELVEDNKDGFYIHVSW